MKTKKLKCIVCNKPILNYRKKYCSPTCEKVVNSKKKYDKYHGITTCKFCDGSGFVDINEDDGEGHITHGTGTKKCVCMIM